MAQLIVVGFKQDKGRAAEVLSRLSALDTWAIDLRDAVAVYREDDGRLRVDQSYRMTTGEGAGLGAFWGTLIGALIAVPFTAGASAPVVAGALAAGPLGGGVLGATGGASRANWWKEDFGLPENFVESVGNMVGFGDSALLALLRAADPIEVAERFRGYGGTVLQTTLTKAQSDKVQSILDGNTGSRMRDSRSKLNIRRNHNEHGSESSERSHPR